MKNICCPMCGTENKFTEKEFEDADCTDYCLFLNKKSIQFEHMFFERNILYTLAKELSDQEFVDGIIKAGYHRKEQKDKRLLKEFSKLLDEYYKEENNA